jgi:hypothetical protein
VLSLPFIFIFCNNLLTRQIIKADEKTHTLDTYASMQSLDPGAAQTSKAAINILVMDINRVTANASSQKESTLSSPTCTTSKR